MNELERTDTTTTELPTTALGAFSSIRSFEDAQRMAKALCSSPLVPDAYRGDSGLGSALIALELSQRMNMSPLMVMQNLDIIYGRPSWRSQMVIAAVNGCGRFSPLRYQMDGEGDEQSCRAYAYDLKNNERLDGPLVNIEMAKQEGWYERNGSKWKTVPELMLRYRAAAWWGRQYAPELLMGLPTADESADVIDVTPKMVVEVPSQASAEIMDRARKLGPADRFYREKEPDQVAITDLAEEHTPPPVEPPEWPRKDEAGVWRDSRNLWFDPDIHSMPDGDIPSVTKHGVFIKKRGCDPRLHEEREKEQWEALRADEESDTRKRIAQTMAEVIAAKGREGTMDEEQELTFGFPEINTAISRSTTLDELADAEDMLNAFGGPEDQLEELKMLVDDRKGRIERVGGLIRNDEHRAGGSQRD